MSSCIECKKPLNPSNQCGYCQAHRRKSNAYKVYHNRYAKSWAKGAGRESYKIYQRDYNRSFKGKGYVMYNAILGRLKHKPSYKNRNLLISKGTFLNWLYTNEDYIRLHKEWIAADYDQKLTPSLDRIDNSRGYSLDNLQIITFSANSNKRTR